MLEKNEGSEKIVKARNRDILPGLIFVDVHSDPVTFRLLEKLVPILKQHGYNNFLAEYRKSKTLESIMTDDKNTIAFCDHIRKIGTIIKSISIRSIVTIKWILKS